MHDVERLGALDRARLLNSPAEPELDRWTAIAIRLLHAPISLLTLVGDERQFFRSSCGLPEPVNGQLGTPLSHSLCRYVVRDREPLVIADARNDPRVSANGAVTELGVGAYLGVPVRDDDGLVLGALCVVDTQAHEWSADDLRVMLDLGAGVESQIHADNEHRDHERLRNILDGHHRVHDLIAAEAPLHEVLEALVLGVEGQTDGMSGSVLLYDRATRCLSHGAAPSLPDAYCAAIDGVEVGPEVGSCGSAAFLGEEVFVECIATDRRWVDFRLLAAEHGLQACWSVPVLDASGDVLATFALYCSRPRSPVAGEITLIRNASRLAGIAVQRHRTQQRLVRLATHDPLTGLPNRVLLKDRLERMLTWRRPPKDGVTVLFCDINGLKVVNDTLGHEVGDRVLETTAERLLGSVRDEDTVARFGGDQFVIAAAGLSTGALRGLADRLVRTLGAPIDDDDASVQRTVSVTVGMAKSDTRMQAQDLLRRADVAMHQAKRAGTSWGFYEEGQQGLPGDELVLHSALHGALDRQELSVVYQPIFESDTGRITAVEALIRWTHPELGRVGPDQFIPIAEKHGLIAAMGDWVLRQAAEQGAVWNTEAERPTLTAVNVSPRQLVDPAFADRVEAILLEAGLTPNLLSIEITETVLMADDATTVRNLRRLDQLGTRLALDDFGTGYSSLSHLRRLPISVVKIDRSFIDGLATEKDDSAIVSGVIGMARGLDLKIIAEGVETKAQADALRGLSCDFMQGYLFARPLPRDAVSKLLGLEPGAPPADDVPPEAGRDHSWRASLAR